MAELVIKNPLPNSVLPYPAGIWNRTKYYFWKTISPGYLFGRDMLLKFNLIHHEGRQDYRIGKLAPGKDIEKFLKHLAARGFANHFIAWKDDGEIASLRHLQGFAWQYHLRIFKDGEVRGHYEYTPEAHPSLHFREVGMAARKNDFLNFCGDWVIPS
jgi:hypothetical protein